MKKISQNVMLVLVVLALVSCSSLRVSRADLLKHPNIIFILTDDMVMSDLQYMPRTKKLIENRGASFSQFLVSISFCCPSRNSILRGQYAQNTKIYDNEPPNGGFERAYASGIEKSMLPVWLHNGGYRTALFGKYMATYPNTAEITYIPPGWTEWYSPVIGYPYGGYNYTMNENGQIVAYGEKEQDYITDVLANKAASFIERSMEQPEPFFAYIAPYAPHKPSTPAPRHAGMFSSLPLPRPPSFDESDMDDKLRSILWRKPLTEDDIAYLEEHYRLRIEALQAVDEMVARIVSILDAGGKLDNTYIFFTSDNGIEMGQHRFAEAKNTPYEDDIRVPLLVSGPGIRHRLKINNIVGNIDIAPTIADLAGVETPDFVDGRSLVLLLLGEKAEVWRDAYLIQRAIAISKLSETSAWYGLRTDQYVYVEFKNGTVQIYDLKKDPYELDNFSPTADPALLDMFHHWLAAMKTCAADSCREYEIAPK